MNKLCMLLAQEIEKTTGITTDISKGVFKSNLVNYTIVKGRHEEDNIIRAEMFGLPEDYDQSKIEEIGQKVNEIGKKIGVGKMVDISEMHAYSGHTTLISTFDYMDKIKQGGDDNILLVTDHHIDYGLKRIYSLSREEQWLYSRRIIR